MHRRAERPIARPTWAWTSVVIALVACSNARADPPAEGAARAPASLTPIVRRLLGAEVTHEACRPLAMVRGEQRYACSITECPGACRVVHVEVVIGVRGGRGRVISRARRPVGDTGECGCCTEAF